MGYRPVGKGFPVFLHPKTHEEYALARTERKVARGYQGFDFYATPDVTLEEDLAQLDEVVVVGYGTQKRSDVTGSVSSVPERRPIIAKPSIP